MEQESAWLGGQLVFEDISALAKQRQPLCLGDYNRVFGQPIIKITLWGIRLHFGQDVPDSGQEHPAYSDDRFLVPATSLDSSLMP